MTEQDIRVMFAAAALSGLLARGYGEVGSSSNHIIIAFKAHQIANAMMKEFNIKDKEDTGPM